VITKPLELENRLSPPPRDLDFMAWVNVALIILFFGLFGSRFVLAPGLPVVVGAPDAINLPSDGVLSSGAEAASVVVTYRRDDVILFEGGMYSLSALKKYLEEQAYIKKHPGAVMLVRADRQVTMQAFIDLCVMARGIGFAKVLVAAEPQNPTTDPK
jgi:biopolymer transport protein ExbD